LSRATWPRFGGSTPEHGEIVAIARDSGEFAAAIGRSIGVHRPTPSGGAWSRKRTAGRRALVRMSDLIAGAIAARARQEERWDARLRRVYQRARRRTAEVVLAVVLTYCSCSRRHWSGSSRGHLRIVEHPSRRIASSSSPGVSGSREKPAAATRNV
jgi:hypothetical protein